MHHVERTTSHRYLETTEEDGDQEGIFNIVFTHGQRPPDVLSFYDAGEATRLRQGATKVRPIGKATTYRNTVYVAQQQPHR